MKLLFDISLLAAMYYDRQNRTGLYRYVSELLSAYSKRNDLELSFAYTSNEKHYQQIKKVLSTYGLSQSLGNRPAYPLPRNLMGRAERYFDLIYKLLSIDVNKILYDDEIYMQSQVFHTPYTPITEKAKSYFNLKRVITIHDLIPLQISKIDEGSRTRMKSLIQSIGDDYAICVSHFTRNDLLNYDRQIQPEKVFVSHLAADTKKFFPCNDSNLLSQVKERYKLPDRFFLSLCTLEPRKNLVHLIRCFIRFIREQHINDLYLILVGSAGWMFDEILKDINALKEYREKIILTGRIPDKDLAPLYSQAYAFYFMSKYEGFGLPPLEAMQCGTPTITSNITSLPEVVGDGGIMLSPDDEDGLCHAMFQLYINSQLRNEYREKGLQRAKEFSWDKCADEHISIFKTIAVNHPENA